MDASLAPELAPRKFKFTSKPGRDRRTRILAAARELLQQKSPDEVSFADVCQKADIPRPSAYHFFPNIQAIFQGLRLLHAETLIQTAISIEEETFRTWEEYLRRLIDVGVEVTVSDAAFPQLIYGYGPDFAETREIRKNLDNRLARLALLGMEQRFVLPEWDKREEVFAVTFAIVDSILRLSFRTRGELAADLIEESKRAATAYLQSYIPAFCPAREFVPGQSRTQESITAEKDQTNPENSSGVDSEEST